MERYLAIKPMLYTEQIKETITFYTDVLGFTCIAFDEERGWASLTKDHVELMLATPNRHLPFNKPVFTGSFYINTDDASVLWEKLKDKCKVCYPIEDFDYGMREFAVYDNNDYLIQFGQQL